MTLCASATGSPCDASAVREDTAPAGLTRSSGFLRDLLSCNDTDKSATNPPPQTPRPLIKVIRTRLAVVNRGQLLAAAETSLLVGLVGGVGGVWVWVFPNHLPTNVTADSLGFTDVEPETGVSR